MSKIKCICVGGPEDQRRGAECPAFATQEDLLCDHCRVLNCPSRTDEEMRQPFFCVQFKCPEHSLPGRGPL